MSNRWAIRKVARNAGTGRFTTMLAARRNPKGTEIETIRVRYTRRTSKRRRS